MNSQPGAPHVRPWLFSAAAIGLLLGFLFVQNARHGWPFSLHHGLPGETRATSGHPATTREPTAPGTGHRRVSVDLAQEEFGRLGILLEPAVLSPVGAAARFPAVVAADEGRIAHVHTRVSGWVERMHVNTTGQSVHAGQPLAQVFSQELFASQNEYLSALNQSGDVPGSAVLEAARTRLAVLGMSAAEIATLRRTAEPLRTVTVVAPRAGIVLRRGVTVGTAVDPSTELLTIADLSQVWVLVEVPEGESARLRVGMNANLAFPSAGKPMLTARVEFIYPTLTERTRTVRVRFEVGNSDGALRPGLFGTASFGEATRSALTVPRDAVVDTGETQHVFVRAANGILEPRSVRLGARVADRVEVLEGLAPGETVVASGVFLIDSESRLRASGGGGHSGHAAPREQADHSAHGG